MKNFPSPGNQQNNNKQTKPTTEPTPTPTTSEASISTPSPTLRCAGGEPQAFLFAIVEPTGSEPRLIDQNKKKEREKQFSTNQTKPNQSIRSNPIRAQAPRHFPPPLSRGEGSCPPRLQVLGGQNSYWGTKPEFL